MLDPLTSSALILLGEKAIETIIKPAVAEHARDLVKKLFETGEGILFGQKEKDALKDVYQGALTHAYTRAIEALSNVLQLMVSRDELKRYRTSVQKFLKSRAIAAHLLETVRDLSNPKFPDPQVLAAEWAALGGEPLPIPGAWDIIAVNFRKGAQEKVFVTPDMRAVLNAQNLDQIRQLGERLLGVQVTVRQEQYVSVMRKTYARVDLARIAPPTADDPGTLIVTDIFEPQDVRENPPPVAITKDELEQWIRAGKLDRKDEQEVIALLEEGSEDLPPQLKFQRASYADQPVRPVLAVVSPQPTGIQSDNALIVITGEPGSGKSTLLRYLLLGILNPPPDPDDPTQPIAWTRGFTAGPQEHFPFLIELRDYHFTCEQEVEVNSLMDYARYLGETMGYGIDDQWLDQRLKSGPALVMFDGLDEIFDPKRRDDVMRQIVGFTEIYPLARVIVTSRPHGYHEGILRPAGFAHYRLQDLDRPQKENFTHAWFSRVFPNEPKNAEQRIERVLNSVDRSPSVRWLAGNPLLLTIMCLIARERELPEERAEFYEQCLDVLVHQWEVNNHLAMEELKFLSVYRKKELLRQIAFEMQASQAGLRGNFITEEELLRITRQWFEANYADLKGSKAEQVAQKMIEGLWQRNYILCPRGPKLYGFLHRTFMEFLTAKEYVLRFEKTEEFTLDDLDGVFREHGNDPDWSEVLRLICGEIGDEFADRLIRTLLILKDFPTAWLDKLEPSEMPYHLVLGIRCMSELRNLSKMDKLCTLFLIRCVNFLKEVGHGEFDDPFMLNEFLESIVEIANHLPNPDYLLQIAPEEDGFKQFGHQSYPDFDAAILRNRDRIDHYACNAKDSTMRRAALRPLVRWWPDEATREFLHQRAIDDPDGYPRAQALQLLAGKAEWADAATREFLHQRAIDDPDRDLRAQALELLAGKGEWADAAARECRRLLSRELKVCSLRAAAVELLAGEG
ncbi:MAG: hypothetical protein AAGG51_20345, partial [Cyanobacteria bacterium P01_G01_bin.54]